MTSFIYFTLIGIAFSLGMYIAFNGLILWILARIFKWTEKRDIKTAYKTSLFMGFVQGLLVLIPLFLVPVWGVFAMNFLIFGLMILFQILIIRYMYSILFWKSAVFWGIVFCCDVLLGFLLFYILNFLFVVLKITPVIPLPYTV